MSSLSQASRLADLPSAHDAFQGHAAHIIEWPTMLRPKDSEGTCIPSGVTTFLQTASRRSLRAGQPALDAARNALANRSARLRLSDVWLEAPVQRPGKLITIGVKLLISACLAPLQQK